MLSPEENMELLKSLESWIICLSLTDLPWKSDVYEIAPRSIRFFSSLQESLIG